MPYKMNPDFARFFFCRVNHPNIADSQLQKTFKPAVGDSGAIRSKFSDSHRKFSKTRRAATLSGLASCFSAGDRKTILYSLTT
ncbi:MAG: hypothetical protein QME32_04750 [Endomicrobiia bacterium]|nr:hypothetical protein [Endomicrobiia bacterium]